MEDRRAQIQNEEISKRILLILKEWEARRLIPRKISYYKMWFDPHMFGKWTLCPLYVVVLTVLSTFFLKKWTVAVIVSLSIPNCTYQLLLIAILSAICSGNFLNTTGQLLWIICVGDSQVPFFHYHFIFAQRHPRIIKDTLKFARRHTLPVVTR